ncbi:uncharacterized protein [Apostichopus japonicus]|uniref:uncharacterized protein isoform X2 n=1 Tax=Stichopus japonicus TaxID=307972 RepID=UPI003AB9076A
MGKLKSVGRYIMEDRTLGKGNFAVVELASHIITSSKVAVKIIDRRKLKEEYMQKNLYREAKVMSKLRHPNIARLYETIKSNNLYFLVTEYVAGGDLLSYVRNQKDGYLSESRSRVYVRQLVSALHHLHERGVVHRDLKMENIILDAKRKNLKLIDFGLSNHYNTDQLLKTHCGSPEYAAPELFVTGREYGPEIDIWSFGIIVYAMVTGKLPFTAPHTENRRQRLLQLINAGLGPIHERDMRNITEDCKDLLRRSIQPSETRIHLLDIQVHPWITANNQDTFYPFQQPPRDPRLKEEVIEKMASLLTVTKSMLEGNVHETRCDELGAMFNLLMDDALRERGLWEGDHTRRSQTPSGEPPVRLRTPTVVRMVRPSDRLQNNSPVQAADFELSIVESEKNTPERPKTATYPPSSLYTRPMGNATTVNIILARQQHFPRPSTQPAKLQHRPVSKTKSGTRPRSCINTPETLLVAPHPSSAELLLSSKDSAATPNQPSHQDGEQISDQKATPKTPDTPETTSSRSKRDMTHKELQTVTSSHSRDMGRKESDQKSVKEPVKKASYTPSNGPVGTKPRPKLQVVDMARHFNAKHGYQVSETPILVQNGPAVSPGATVRKSPAKPHSSERRASLNLCDGHLSEFRENDLSKDDSSGDRRHSIAVANISEKSRKQRSATPVLLRLRHRDGKEAAHQEPSELRKSRVKKGDARRHSLGVTRDLSQSRSSGISSYVPSRSQTPSISETMTSSSQNSRPGTSRNPSRSLYKTPIASVIASDGNLAHRSRRERRASDSVGEMTVKSPTGMPSRLEWKRTSSAERKIATQSLNMTKEKTSGYTSEGNSRGVLQVVPDKTMRIQSAKIKSREGQPPSGHVHQDQNSCRAMRARKEHVTSSNGENQKMLKYTGYHTDELKDTNLANGDEHSAAQYLGNFSTRGLLGLILVSPNSSKTQKPLTDKDETDSKSQISDSSSGPPRQKYVNIAPFNFFDKSQLCNTTTKSIDVTKPPVVKPKGSKGIQVFDIQKSHDVTSVPLPSTASETSRKPNSNGVDWGKTYCLERKVSDTLKGSNEIVKLRKTPEPVRDG